MEKASTPRNRLTRSSAKQVNTPKNIDQEDSADKSPNEEIKHNSRKTRRRNDSKVNKTNGETTSIENRMNNEEVVEDNMGDRAEQEDLKVESQDSPKTSNQKTPSPTISRRSLRTRRSVTPGPELETSTSKKMTRSSSSGILDCISTPTNRRARRSKSESKDFVFTPTKEKHSGSHDSNGKYIPNPSLKIGLIEKIDEVNETEKSSEDEKEDTNHKSKDLNNVDSKRKTNEFIEQDVLDQQTLNAVSEKDVKEIDLSTNLKIDVDQNVYLKDSNLSKDNEIIDIPINSSESLNDITKTEGKGDIDAKMEVGECKLKLESSQQSKDNDTPCTTNLLETIGLQEAGNVIEEMPQSGDSESKTISECEKKTILQQSTTIDELSENPDNKIDNSPTTNENTMENNVMEIDENPEDKRIEIEVDEETDETGVKSFKGEQLQEIVAEGMEESSDNENGKHSLPEKELQEKTETSEISKIDLINSSDSEESRPENHSLINSDENRCSDNTNINIPEVEKSPFKNECFQENFCSETREAQSDPVPITDFQVINSDISIHDNLQCEKVMEDVETNHEPFEINALEGHVKEPPVVNTEPDNILVEDPTSIQIINSVPDKLTGDLQDNIAQNPSLQDQHPNLEKSHDIKEQNKSQEKSTYDGSHIELNEQECIDQSEIVPEKDSKLQSRNNYDDGNYSETNFDENYEEEELIKSEEGSCDIYKGLSDSGSYDDEKDEGSQFGESVTSELQSGSENSEEEYGTSVEEEEEVENIAEKTRLINELCSGSMEQKAKELLRSKDGEKPNDKNPDSPMTYDKALAIINKNRVKKIDDEEFYDMFTQELNRVSEESGSDSDIAIVDEYLLEPEEPAKKNQPKPENSQTKQPQKMTGPPLSNQSMPPDILGNFNQPMHPQHGNVSNQHSHLIPPQPNHPAMSQKIHINPRIYQQFDQNMHLRGQLMYNEYAHPSSNLQGPSMYNPLISHPDVSFRSGMFNHPHPQCSTSESPFPPNSTSLKVRTVTDVNTAQSFDHKNLSHPDQASFNTSEERIGNHHEFQENRLNMSPAGAAGGDTGGSKPSSSASAAKTHEFADKRSIKPRTPILDLLGLDKKALKQLKEVLGLNSIERQLLKRDPEKKYRDRNVRKSDLRQRKKKKESKYVKAPKTLGGESSSLKSSSDQSSEDDSIGSSSISKDESSSENENREVSIEEGSVYVTLKPKDKPRHRHGKEFQNYNKIAYVSAPKSPKSRSRMKPRHHDLKKMKQQQPTVVKSKCGTFTVDPLTTSSQSDSEVSFQSSLDSQVQVQELKRKMKRDLASGKNKLSNMFAQHSYKKAKLSRKNESEFSDGTEGSSKLEHLKKSRKLPSEILETLAKEDKRKKRLRTEEDSGSDDAAKRPKKIRKKNNKIKVKSKAGDQNYIPCVTGGATEFGLSRLDKDGTLTLAEKAAKFRTDQLYGSSVKRITILDFKHQWC